MCDWETRAPVVVTDTTEIKTIGSRYCDDPACLDAEAKAHGLPLERVKAWHRPKQEIDQVTQENRAAKRAGRVVLQVYAKYEDRVREFAISKGTTCRAGCSHCCKLPASATVPEMVPVVAYLVDRIDWYRKRPLLEQRIRDYLAVQFPVDPTDSALRSEFFKAQVPCVFLDDDGTCSVYPVRPSACRYHYVVSPPENCAVGAADNVVARIDLRKLEDLVLLQGARALGSLVGGSIPSAFAVAAQMMGVELAVDEHLVAKTTWANISVESAETAIASGVTVEESLPPPGVVSAAQWTGTVTPELERVMQCDEDDWEIIEKLDLPALTVPTARGVRLATVGEWVLRTSDGDLYTCRPDLFAEKYRPRDDGMFER